MNQTILSNLRTLPEKSKSSWKNPLIKVIYAYYLFGRKPRLPTDLIHPTEEDFSPWFNHKGYLESWKKEMEGAFEAALTKSTGRKEKDRRKLKSGSCLGILKSGEKVLIRNLSPRGGSGKLRSFWEQNVAEVNKKTSKWCDLLHQNNLTVRSLKITLKHVNVCQSYITNSRWCTKYLLMIW